MWPSQGERLSAITTTLLSNDPPSLSTNASTAAHNSSDYVEPLGSGIFMLARSKASLSDCLYRHTQLQHCRPLNDRACLVSLDDSTTTALRSGQAHGLSSYNRSSRQTRYTSPWRSSSPFPSSEDIERWSESSRADACSGSTNAPQRDDGFFCDIKAPAQPLKQKSTIDNSGV